MDDQQLVAAYTNGASIGELAAREERSYTWTRRRLLNAGAVLRERSQRECPVAPEKLAEQYRAGASIRSLAELHGLYYKRVREILLEQGVELRPRKTS